MSFGKHSKSVFFVNHPRASEIEQLFRDMVKAVAQDEDVHGKLGEAGDVAAYDRLLREIIEATYHFFTEGKEFQLFGEERERFFADVFDDIKGLGPIEQLLRDPDVTEVMVNGPDCIFVEKGGLNQLTPLRFIDEKHLLASIQEIVAPLNRRVDVTSPMVDARLPNGSRVNAVIAPVALGGPFVTIRKFPRSRYSLQALIELGALTKDIAEFCRVAVQARLNILVSGGAGSGKTTMLNAISEFIAPEARLVVVEDTAELTIHEGRKNVCRLEARPPNSEGKGEITIRQLVKNTLRMRPDRIVVGEVRGEEAFDLVQAMNTGHDGSLTTAHANSCWDVLNRLESMVIMAGTHLTLDSIRDLITSGIHLIVHLARFRDGSRRIVEVASVEPAGADGRIQIVPIWTFVPKSDEEPGPVVGEYVAHTLSPRLRRRIESQGIALTEPPNAVTVPVGPRW